MEILDYLKSNCRSWEDFCDNEEDTLTLAHHLSHKCKKDFETCYLAAAHWTGYDNKINNLEKE